MQKIHKHTTILSTLTVLMVLLMLPSANSQVIFEADFESDSGVNAVDQWVPDNAGQAWGKQPFPGSGTGIASLNEGCGMSGDTPLAGVNNFVDGFIQLDMSWADDDSWGVIVRKTADDAGYLIVFGYIETPSIIVADLADGCADTGFCLDQTTCENGGLELIQVDHGLGADLTMDLTVSYTGRIQVEGNTIRAWYLPTADVGDRFGNLGTPTLEFETDGTHSGPGSVGVWHESQGGSMIDNVSVTGPDGFTAVDPQGKLPTSWATIKAMY